MRGGGDAVDVDRRLAEAFQAPEGVWNKDAERIRLDVFALGALAYYVLAGRPAAADRAALRERLHRDNGLDLAVIFGSEWQKIFAAIWPSSRAGGVNNVTPIDECHLPRTICHQDPGRCAEGNERPGQRWLPRWRQRSELTQVPTISGNR